MFQTKVHAETRPLVVQPTALVVQTP